MPKHLPANLALSAIRLYQRHVSPRKGYACAYRLLHGGSGCSGVGYRLIRRYGLWSGYALLRRRFERCRAAREQLNGRVGGLAYAQRGDCDCAPDCAPDCLPDIGDLNGKHCVHDRCDTARFWDDALSCGRFLDCGCDWPRKQSPSER